MPIFQLSKEIVFPPVELAEPEGLLAIGGDLGAERLLKAYSLGIFPWFSEGMPLLWWSPDPRMVLLPPELRVSRSLERLIRKGSFMVTIDKAFGDVIRNCVAVHADRSGGTWITEEMVEAYTALHHQGYAHSVETWQENALVGGLYGISLGGAFFGESMFTLSSNASKVAFVSLVRLLDNHGFAMVDCQMETSHLARFGARKIPRGEFIRLLELCLENPPPQRGSSPRRNKPWPRT